MRLSGGHASRYLRIAATALTTAGLVILTDVVITIAWGEPLSAIRASLSQKEAAQELSELEQSYPAAVSVRRIPVLAKQLVSSAEPGQGIGRLRIDAIEADPIVVQGIETKDLEKGPGHYPDTALPGAGGTTAIAGHRTTFGAPFLKIDSVGEGDEIVLEMPYGTFTYVFERQRIVEPSQVDVVRDIGHERLVLTACHPRYSAAQRIVLFARLTELNPRVVNGEERSVPAGALERAQRAGR